mmetsp:Transcript_15136/g.32361  ORF Transcript_15136/g.32361 Transcript_15136/m.32361 type:complete len:118 (+) Transcript_15136:1677-2030(+)
MKVKEVVVIKVWCGSNNTHINVQSKNGSSFLIKTSGSLGIRKAKRGLTAVGIQLAETVGNLLVSKGFKRVSLFLSGFGKGRFSIFKGFYRGGLQIENLFHVQKQRYNGCRQKKVRRV